MSSREVDVAILGAGTAGLAAYRQVLEYTDNVVVIDGGPLGTTCARVGCMPSKLLIAAADAAHHSRHSALFGVHNEQTRVDGKAVMARVKSERDRFVGFVLESIDGIPQDHKISASAEFVDDHTLQLSNGETIKAKSVVVATGSRPFVPPIFKNAGSRLLTNDEIFELDELPASVAVIGPGVIGLELGQALSRLGVNIKVFGVGGSLAAISDPVVKAKAEKIFSEEYYLDIDAKIEQVQEQEEGVVLHYQHKNGDLKEERFDYILVATGRRPNLDKVGLDKTSIQPNERGLPSIDPYTLQTDVEHIFIAGDANNDRPLLHEAADEGKIAGANAAQYPKKPRAGLRRSPLAVVFSDPQVAFVGMSYQQVQAKACDCYAVGEVQFDNQGRSRVMGLNKGILRVYGEQGSGIFLGAELIGPRAEHLAHLLAWAHQQRMTVSQMLEMPFYHPVIEEGLRTALRDLNAKLNIGQEYIENCMDCGPGT